MNFMKKLVAKWILVNGDQKICVTVSVRYFET